MVKTLKFIQMRDKNHQISKNYTTRAYACKGNTYRV